MVQSGRFDLSSRLGEPRYPAGTSPRYIEPMPLRLLDRTWDPDSAANADWSWSSESTAVLLDGAAPRSTQRVTPAADDTVWLVRRFVEAFAAAPGGNSDMRERTEHARAVLKREFAALCASAGFTPEELPFACLVIAHHEASELQLFNMGDLTTLVRSPSGAIQRFGESAVRELDRRALDELRRYHEAGVEPHAERRARVGPTILLHRAQRNQLPGYDVLDLEAGGADRFEHLTLPARDVRDLLMMSDGFYRLVDTFERYTDDSLFQAVEQRGLAALLHELRDLEQADPECTRHWRFKRHDDATALWLAVG